MGHSLLLILTPLYGRSPLKISDHDELEGSFLIDAIELLSKHEAYSQSARKEAGMIKKIENYPELADPQLQPRYTGIPTFFRLPHTMRLDEVDIGLVGVPFDGGITNRPGARHGPRDIRNQSSLIRKTTRRPAWRPSTSSASPIWGMPGSNAPSSYRAR